MTEERSFQLLDSANEPAVNRSPNYLRLLQAYRSYIEQGASADECALRLTEITQPGLRRFHFPPLNTLPIASQQQAEHLNSVVREMVLALNSGDRASLASQFKQATCCFQEMSTSRFGEADHPARPVLTLGIRWL